MSSFAERGVAATSLDELARRLGVTKQTILYHFGSKDRLLTEVFRSGALELRSTLEETLAETQPGWSRVEAVVRATFGLAVRRPELLGLLREVGRVGTETSAEALAVLQPLVDTSVDALEEGMRAGRFRTSDPRLVLVSAYALTSGVVTDPELLRSVGLVLDLRVAAQLRRTVLDFLRAALAVEPETERSGSRL